jgi:hypothetical protein
MTLHRDTIVQLTHDTQLRRGLLIKRGTSGRVLSKVALHHACVVEFTVDGKTVSARVEDHDLAEVRPNARV